MNTDKLKLTGIALFAAITSSSLLVGQSVSLQINTPNFADSAGEILPNGTPWGVIFDVQGNHFAGSEGGSDLGLLPFSTPLEFGSRPNSMVPSELGDGLGLVWVTGSTAIPGGPAAGPGAFGTANAVEHTDGAGIASTGDQFGLIWFPGLADGATPQGGDSYGFYTNPNLTMPSSGDSAVNFSGFIDNAAIKTADYTVVPEPSTYAAIFGAGVLLFVFLRRRFKKSQG